MLLVVTIKHIINRPSIIALNLTLASSPVHLPASFWAPLCLDLVEGTQTQRADHSKCAPVCSPRRCWGDLDCAACRCRVASHGGPARLPGRRDWSWWCRICHQSSGSEGSLQDRGQSRMATLLGSTELAEPNTFLPAGEYLYVWVLRLTLV